MWWFMLICDMITPLLMLIGGWMMWKHCPKKINGVFGYRTSRSMKNDDTWRFAHEYCGKLWWKIGWMMLPLSLLISIPLYLASELLLALIGLIVMFIQLAILFYSIYLTEKALKQHFAEDGFRK